MKLSRLNCPALVGKLRVCKEMLGNPAGKLGADPVVFCLALQIPCASTLTLADQLSAERSKLHLPFHFLQGCEV